MPTYTGSDNVGRALNSIAEQKIKNFDMEVIVVVDGPNEQLRDLVNSYQPVFTQRGVTLRCTMLKKNRGVFKALQQGVKLASGQWIVMTGDRILLPSNYLSTVAGLNKEVLLAETEEENWQKSAINKTLHHLRRRLYKNRGQKIITKHIDQQNFEKSGKGSGGMWIKKDLFLWACGQMSSTASQKHISDDTKLLRVLVDSGHPIFWTNQTHIIYSPRPGFSQQVNHIFRRGPKFVDYYIKPKTRYFLPLILTIILTLVIIILLIVRPEAVLWLTAIFICIVIAASLYLSEKPADILSLVWAIPVIILVFYLGLVKGLVIHFLNVKKVKVS